MKGLGPIETTVTIAQVRCVVLILWYKSNLLCIFSYFVQMLIQIKTFWFFCKGNFIYFLFKCVKLLGGGNFFTGSKGQKL